MSTEKLARSYVIISQILVWILACAGPLVQICLRLPQLGQGLDPEGQASKSMFFFMLAQFGTTFIFAVVVTLLGNIITAGFIYQHRAVHHPSSQKMFRKAMMTEVLSFISTVILQVHIQ